ncbi:hypothetical protein BB777_14530 [Planococcus faecalis]|nr:hypothetical protein BB777_14530 [Planococcus faecalis]
MPVLILTMNCIRYGETMLHNSLALHQVMLFSLNIVGILYVLRVMYKGKKIHNKPTAKRHFKI